LDIDIAAYRRPWNGHCCTRAMLALRWPTVRRSRIVLNDGRNHLSLTNERMAWDFACVVSPWTTTTWSLHLDRPRSHCCRTALLETTDNIKQSISLSIQIVCSVSFEDIRFSYCFFFNVQQQIRNNRRRIIYNTYMSLVLLQSSLQRWQKHIEFEVSHRSIGGRVCVCVCV
jgi:hypothetical protein